MNRLSSLRARMTLGFTAWFTLVALLACVLFLFWSRQLAYRDQRERLRTVVQFVVEEWEHDAGTLTASEVLAEAQEDMRTESIALFIVDRNGKVLGANRLSALSVSEMRQQGWLIEEAHSLNATIIVGINWQVTEAILQRQILLLSLLALLVVGAGGAGAWYLVGRTLRPIGVLAEEAKFASADSLQARLHSPSNDAEVRLLVETLNDFLERFQESTRNREQFYAAAAHELRTPLTVLSGNIELALARPRTAEDHVETLRDLQQETIRLADLTESLLTMNHLQTSSEAEERERVDVMEECEHVLAALQPVILKRHLQIMTEWTLAHSDLFAPRSHVVILLRNLVENAAKYAPIGGTVHLRTDVREGAIHVSVYNDFEDANNLPLEKIYEPFFRADSSRSVETGGNGLGLALCRRLADVHGWSLKHVPTSTGILAEVTFLIIP